MSKIVLIALIFTSIATQASEYDVDWPTSNSKEHVLAITIDKCETRFPILNSQFKEFSEKINDNKFADSLIKTAKTNTLNGCKGI